MFRLALKEMELLEDKVYCYICYKETYEELICDTCEEYYCEDCSYIYTLHYQFEGCRCYICSNQYRISPLNKSEVRENKINYLYGKFE